MRRYKAKHGCSRCGEQHPACLDLHHRDPSTKSPKLSKNKGGKWYTGGSMWKDLSYELLAVEIAKCDVICSNCHRKETALARGYRYDVPPITERSNKAREAAERALGLIL